MSVVKAAATLRVRVPPFIWPILRDASRADVSSRVWTRNENKNNRHFQPLQGVRLFRYSIIVRVYIFPLLPIFELPYEPGGSRPYSPFPEFASIVIW